MALPVIEVDGTDVVDADEVADRSVTIRRQALDLTLINPGAMPAIDDTVTCDDPSFSGVISRIKTREFPDALYVDITATNASTLSFTSAPHGISDNPNGTTTFGYTDLEMQYAKANGVSETQGELITYEPGLEPGQTFQLTSALNGLSADDFVIRDITVKWLTKDQPEYQVSFAIPLVTPGTGTDRDEDGLPDDDGLGGVIRDIADQAVEDGITGNGSGACCGLDCTPLLGDGGSSLAEWQITNSPDDAIYEYGVADGSAFISRGAGAQDSDFLTCILVLPDDYRDQFPDGFRAGFSVIFSGALDVGGGDHREAEAKMTIGGTSGSGGWDMNVTAGRQVDLPGIPEEGYLVVTGDAHGTPYSDSEAAAEPADLVAMPVVITVTPTGASVTGLGETIPVSEPFDTSQFQSIQLTLSLNMAISYELRVTAVDLVPLDAGSPGRAPWCDSAVATRVGVADAGGYYSSNNVEDALQEAAQRSAFFEDAGSGTVRFQAGFEQLLDTNETAFMTLDAAYAEIGTNDAYFVGDDDSVFIQAAEEVDVQAAHGLIVPRLGSDPASPADGAIWYRTDTDKLRLRANGSTVDLN